MGYWDDKKILITGGSAGLGRALVEAFLAAGANVLAVGRDETRLTEAAVEVEQQLGKRPLTFRADVTSASDVERLFQFVASEWGSLDALVNNVGQSTRGNVLSTSPEEFQRSWEVNFLSVTHCTSRAAELLIASGGHVINIGSLASKSSAPHLGAYPHAKFAVAAYSQQLRWELEPQGVHVLLVCPGPIQREDAGTRYDDQAGELPAGARKPGAGVRVKGIAPQKLAQRILKACRCKRKELIVPAKAKLLFVVSQISPAWGDWLVRKMTKN